MATLEEIQLKVDEVKSKIPSIKQGIEALSASDLSEGAGAIEPVVPTTTTPGAGAAITNVTGIQQMLGTMMAQRDKEIADIKEQQVEKQSMWQKMLGDKKSSAEILKEQYTAVEESPAYKEVQRISAQMEPLNLQIADLTNQETAEIERNELRLASGIAKDMAETAIHNKYNRLKAPIATQMNAYAANAMLYEGQLDKAYQYADAAVQAAVYDQEFQYNTMRDFMESNDDFLNSLQKTDRDYFDNALNLSAQAYSEAKADREYVMDLQMQSGGQANITINDTRQEAQGKYADWLGQQTTTIDTKAPTTKMVNGVLHEWDAVNGEWKPSKIATTETGEIPAPPAYVSSFGQYKDAGWTRTQVENNWISQYNAGKTAGMQIKDINEMNKSFPEIKSALDEVYKSTTPGTWEILKEVPGVVGDWVSNLFK